MDDGLSNIGSLHSKYDYLKKNKNKETPFLYALFLGKEGKVEDEKMKKSMEKLISGIKLNE